LIAGANRGLMSQEKTTVHFDNALRHLGPTRRGETTSVAFIAPVLSTLIAAECLRRPAARTHFSLLGDAVSYGKTVGLASVLAGSFEDLQRTRYSEATYSPLARLATHADVEGATDTVTECLHRHLDSAYASAVDEICRIIGELHDNVASHARGAGFSALQV
jgi:hypothetical protein